jgi:1,2-phenylacetyl-CoA epoxidase catalytic subunit
MRDENERLRSAIATLWPELPGLFGPDWHRLEGVLRAYLLQLMRCPVSHKYVHRHTATFVA